MASIFSITKDTALTFGASGYNFQLAKSDKGAQDSISLSTAAQNLAQAKDGLSGAKATSSSVFGASAEASFNFSTGAITAEGHGFNLKGFASTTGDDIAIVKESGTTDDLGGGNTAAYSYKVYNTSKGTMAYADSQGNLIKSFDEKKDSEGNVTWEQGKNPFSKTAAYSATATGDLLISNKGQLTGGGGNDVLFMRSASSSFDTGAGDDKVFAYGGIGAGGNTGAGNDAIYATRITGGTINMSAAGATDANAIFLSGAATGGTLNMEGKDAIMDANKSAISNMTINMKATDNNILAASSLSNTKLNMEGTKFNALDVSKGLANKTEVTMSKGISSIIAGAISGTGNKIDVSGVGTNSSTLLVAGGISGLTYKGAEGVDGIQSKGNIANSSIDLSSGANSLNITHGGLSKTGVSAGALSTTAISAKSITGDGTSNTAITLGDGGNLLSVAGAVSKVNINTGKGENTVSAASMNTVTLQAGDGTGTAAQNLTVSGAVSKLTYAGGNGNDTLSMKSLANSSIDLGDGQNNVTVAGAVARTDFTADGNSATNLNMKSYSGSGSNAITLGNGGNTIKVAGAFSGANVSLGAGANTFDVGSITGSKNIRTTIAATTTTTNTQTISVAGSINYMDYIGGAGKDILTSKGAISNALLDLGKGDNTLTATNKDGTKRSNLSNVSITATGGGSNVITAGSFVGNGSNSITLDGASNTISLSGAVSGVNIDMGTGAATFSSGAINGTNKKGVTLSMESGSASIAGGVNYLTFTGGTGANTITTKGAIANSSFDLGAGANSLSAYDSAKNRGFAINNTDISAGTGGTSIRANSFSGKGSDAASITLGDAAGGLNSLVLDKGLSLANVTMSGTGSNTVSVGSVTGSSKVTSSLSVGADSTTAQSVYINGNSSKMNLTTGSGADTISIKGNVTDSTIDMNDGANTLNMEFTRANSKKASYGNLAGTNVYSGSGGTTITAGSFSGKGNNAATMDIGSALGNSNGNSVTLKGTVSNASIAMTGSASNTLDVGKIAGTKTKGVGIAMGGDEATNTNASQNLTVRGAVSFADIATGDKTNDVINIMGNMANSTMEMGSGANTLDMSATRNSKEVRYSITGSAINAGDGGTTISAKSFGSAGTNAGTINLGYAGMVGTGTNAQAGNQIDLSGTLSGATISMGTGANSFSAKNISGTKTKGVTLNMGGATSTDSQTVNVGGAVNYLNFTGASGADTFNALGNVNNSNLDLGSGANTINLTGKNAAGKDVTFGMTASNVTSAGNDGLTLRASNFQGKNATEKATLNMGGGANSVELSGGLKNTNLSVTGGLNMALKSLAGMDLNLGTGANNITAGSLGGATQNSKVTINMGTGASTGTGNTVSNTLTITGNAQNFTFNGGDANDVVDLQGNAINSNFNLGAGNNTFTTTNAATGKGFAQGTNIRATGTGNTTVDVNRLANNGTTKSGIDLSGITGSTTINVGDMLGESFINLGANAATVSIDKMTGTSTSKQASITGTGANTQNVNVAGDTKNANINLAGSGNNSFTTKNLFASSVSLGSGNSSYSVTEKMDNSAITLGAGNNNVSVGNMTNKSKVVDSVTAGTGSNTIYVASMAKDNTVNLDKGNGNNKITVGELIGSISAKGTGDNTVSVTNMAKGSSITTGSGANTVSVSGTMTDAKVTMDGINKKQTFTVGGATSDSDLTFIGTNNSITFGEMSGGTVTTKDTATSTINGSNATGTDFKVNGGTTKLNLTGGMKNGSFKGVENASLSLTADAALENVDFVATGTGTASVEAGSISGGSYNMKTTNNKLVISAAGNAISNAKITMEGDVNLLNATGTTAITGANKNNTITNSNISVTGKAGSIGDSNVILGSVSDGNTVAINNASAYVFGTARGNFKLSGETYLGIQDSQATIDNASTKSTMDINKLTGGKVNVTGSGGANNIQLGSISGTAAINISSGSTASGTMTFGQTGGYSNAQGIQLNGADVTAAGGYFAEGTVTGGGFGNKTS